MNTNKLSALAISDNGFIFDPETGHSFTTNSVGILILNMLKENKELLEIGNILMEEYDVTKNELESDIQDFIDTLKSAGLVFDSVEFADKE